MDRFVRWSQWGEPGLMDAGQMLLSKIPETLRMFEAEAAELLKSSGADHVVYAWKEYDDNGDLKEISFYMMPFDDTEFEKRIQPLDGIIYALHKLA